MIGHFQRLTNDLCLAPQPTSLLRRMRKEGGRGKKEERGRGVGGLAGGETEKPHISHLCDLVPLRLLLEYHCATVNFFFLKISVQPSLNVGSLLHTSRTAHFLPGFV